MRRRPVSRDTTQLIAYAALCAVSVGSLYIVQALLPVIAPDLGFGTAAAGLLVAAVQFGYAAGLLLLVTRADDARMRSRSAIQLAVLGAAFCVAATQYHAAVALVAFVVIGLVATVGQSLLVISHGQAAAHRSTHRVAVLTAAMLVGMFGGRVLAGASADIVGWRAVLAGFSVLAVLSVPVLLRSVPRPQFDTGRGAPPVRSALTLLRNNIDLRRLAMIQFFAFAAFTAMWTVIAVHLTGPTVQWSIAQANWFGIVGLSAGLVAPALTTGRGARVLARGRPRAVGFTLLAVGTALATGWPASIPALVTAMFSVTVANQLIHAVNQDRAMSLVPEDRAKANAVFMMVVFIGGTLGAALGPLGYALGGLPTAAFGALCAGLLGALIAARFPLSSRPDPREDP